MSSGIKAPRPANRRIITLDRITVRVRDRWLLHDTFWEIRENQHWVLLGPNGSGKSSLAGVFTGGTPVVQGRIIRHTPDLSRNHTGYVSFELHEKILTRENRLDESRYFSGRFDSIETVKSFLETGLSRHSGVDARLSPVFSGKWIGGLLNRPVRRLSIGEMRKVLIARALAGSPRLLILDEPFEGLDSESMSALSAMIRETADLNPGLTIILATHRLERIPSCFTHVLGLREGRVVFNGKLTATLIPDLEKRLYGAGPSNPARHAIPERPPDKRKTIISPALVQMTDVTVRYDDNRVLDGLTWTMKQGEHWAVSGPNGSGKTTLLTLISGDNPQAYANRIYLFGRRRGSGESIWDIKKRIGIVSSEFQMGYDRPVSVFEAVASGFFDSVGLYRKLSPEQEKTAQKWVNAFHLESLRDQRLDRLSFGQRRLALLARALVKHPLLLILDEPCQGLDIENRRMVLNVIELIAGNGFTNILYVTHFQEELPACITHVLRLEKQNGEYTAFQNDEPSANAVSEIYRSPPNTRSMSSSE